MTETPNERFEREAAEFHADNPGFLAPGKSEPCDMGACNFDRNEVRRRMFDAWKAGRKREATRAEKRGEEKAYLMAASLVPQAYDWLQKKYEDLEARANKEAGQ